MNKLLLTVTPEEIRRELRARGMTVAGWARARGFNQSLVYAVISGRSKGLRGAAHEVAKALNLIPAPDESERFRCLDDPEQLENSVIENTDKKSRSK